MKTLKKDLFSSQSLKEIRQELLEIGIKDLPDEEYVALITRHTANLLELAEKLNLKTDSFHGIRSTLSFLFDNLSEPVCVINKATQVIYFNDFWKKKYSSLHRQKSGKEFFSGINRDIIYNTIEECEKIDRRKIVTLKLDKTEHLLSIMPFDGVDGDLCFLMFSLNNGFIDQVKEIESQAKHTRDKNSTSGRKPNNGFVITSSLLNAIDGFYFTLDTDLTIVQISSAIERKLGYKSSELINKSFLSLLSAGSKDEIQEIAKLESAARMKENVQNYRSEIEVLDQNKEINSYDLTLTFDRGKRIFSGICIDMQHYKAREQELIEARINAEMNDRHKTDFLANMSHEIRTPLNGIVGFSTMLHRNHLDKAKREKYLRIIRTSTQQLLTLVNDIIDISKIEASQFKIHFEKADVHQILEDLQTTFVAEAHRLGKENVKLIKQTGRPNSKIYIRNDEVRLKQVLSNLIGNALKFTDDGSITFGYSLGKDETIRFFVKDTGAGIPKSAQRSIFNRFKQSREGMKNKHQGTGLGLAISKGIVELMGGNLSVVSEPGAGSEFYFVLPLTLCE